MRPNTARNGFGHFENKRGFARHSDIGLSWTTVSIIENGAGSVEESTRPALPWTLMTSGNCLRMRSCVAISRCASVTEMPGNVVGMYRMPPSLSGGMNSWPSFRYTGTVVPTINTASAMVVFGQRNTSRHGLS